MNYIIKREDLRAIIQSKIYVIRGIKVMLDRDLADLYGVETRTLNQKVKRNLRRFPPDFMFQMTKEDMEEWKSQIVISNSIKMGLRKPPYAFTLFGVAMLSSVLNSETAIDTNIDVMRAFVEYQTIKTLVKYGEFQELKKKLEETNTYIEELLEDQNEINESTRAQLEAINTAIAELQVEHRQRPKRKPIGFIQPKDDNDTQ
ncbi:MAG: ORF6N domain-containing protein [Prevotella sp.]|nr:ORF6N domain-containing protein [Prevotella sp.]